ncbi:MAG: IS1595 family transposase [Sphingomonadales bacterium]
MFSLTHPVYNDENAAREHLESIRWPDGPYCPHCGEVENVHRLEGKSHRPGLLYCRSCRGQFSVTVGTVFERSKISLCKWVLATHLLCASKKGMSAHQLHRMLGVTYKTAWFMAHRIREAMTSDVGPLGGGNKVVEADETYVGGKAKNRAHREPAPKKAVVALVEREGKVASKHVANVTAKTLRPMIVTKVDRASHLMTDESAVYTRMGDEFAGHSTVNHSANEYARAAGFKHTNTVENFFSIFKRGVIGTYHHLSEAHLDRYCAEFDFRYNHRKISDRERADEALKGITGKRLTYRRSYEAANA